MTYAGFSAQNVQLAIPEVVGTDPQGFLTLQNRPLVAASINAIKELNHKLEDLATTSPDPEVDNFTNRFFSSLFARLTAWFADTANGINDFFARVGDFGQVNTDELCVGATCVTEDQFKSLLNGGSSRRRPNATRYCGSADGLAIVIRRE